MSKGKLEKTLVDPYLPNKIVPPEYIRDVLDEANRDFPLVEFEYEVPPTCHLRNTKTDMKNWNIKCLIFLIGVFDG